MSGLLAFHYRGFINSMDQKPGSFLPIHRWKRYTLEGCHVAVSVEMDDSEDFLASLVRGLPGRLPNIDQTGRTMMMSRISLFSDEA